MHRSAFFLPLNLDAYPPEQARLIPPMVDRFIEADGAFSRLRPR
ncbi:DUF2274 domain-containing protein [Sandaracinobacteroides hominis]